MEIVKDEAAFVQRMKEATPDRCCTCQGRWRQPTPEEGEAIMMYMSRVDLPETFLRHRVVGAMICADCGHVMLLTQYKKWWGVLCPGFGLHATLGRTL